MKFVRSIVCAILVMVGASAGSAAPVHAASASLTEVGLTSPCQDVVVVGARGSGQSVDLNNGLGPEAWSGAQSYADQLGPGYRLGYYPLTYAAIDFRALISPKSADRKRFFDSIDNGVNEALSFLSVRESRCRASGERYVLIGFSQGAMVMHRVLWQLTDPKNVESSKTNYQLAVNLLPRIDGVLAIADGDRVSNQGGNQIGSAGAAGYGVWWSLGAKGVASVKYKPENKALPTVAGWSPDRFFSVCVYGDAVCDWSAGGTLAGLVAHGTQYQPGGVGSSFVQVAANRMAALTQLTKPPSDPPPPTGPTTPVRVGQWASAPVTDLSHGDLVSYMEWVSEPLADATLTPGSASEAFVSFRPVSPGTYPYAVKVTFYDGTTSVASGAFVAYPIPNASLAIRNVTSTFDAAQRASRVALDVVKVSDSTTTPTMVSDINDPASDQYTYESGDTDANQQLDLGETWHYSGYIPWSAADTSTTRVVTLVLFANDATGAGEFLEQSGPDITLTR